MTGEVHIVAIARKFLLGSSVFVFALALVATAAPAATVPTAQLTSALHWRSVGPYSGGRVTSVAGVPGQPNHYYAGYAGSGVWETDDYGQHWKNLTDKYFKPDTSGTVGAIAVAQSNPKIIYAGTGDSAPRNTVLTGHGVYKSTDGGKTWKYVGLGETHIITWILLDPKNPEVVYVGALGHLFAPNPERGVFKSTDGGKTWNKILYVDDHTGVATMAMDPQDPNVLYVAMWQMSRHPWTFASGGPGSGIYKTTDGGKTWKNITHNPGLPTGDFGKVGLAVAPSNPNVVYALVQARYKDQAGALFRSNDGGATWKFVNDNMAITQRAFYYGRVYVDPKDPDTIYMPNAELIVSHDGGKTLRKLDPPHGDNHALWIDPQNPQIFIEGNDGGATVTLNGGKSWSPEMNQPTGQFYHANLDEDFPFDIYGAQQDRGSVYEASAVRGGKIPPVWHDVMGGEMTWVVPTPGQPWVTYGSGYYSKEWKENRRTKLVTNVSAWPAYKFGLKGSEIRYRFGWTHHPVVFAPTDPNELLVGANVVLKSMDAGIHWTAISPDLTRNDKSKQQRPGGEISADVTGEEMFDTISALAGSPLSNGTIWAGSDDGLVHVTTDGGKNWSGVRPADLPEWSTITSIDPSHTSAGTAFLSASRYGWDDFHPYVYKTTDYGKHWTKIIDGLPDDQYVLSVRQDPDDPDLLFAATSASVYMSLDGGAHWQSLALNLPAVRVSDIEIQPKQHAVVISTFGRAFWVLDNLQFLEQLNKADVASDSPYLFKPQQAWLVTRSSGGESGSDEPGGSNSPAGVTVFFHLPANYKDKMPVELTFTTESGKVIDNVKLPVKPKKNQEIKNAFAKPEKKPAKLHPGMNRYQWNLRYPNAADIKGIYNSYFAAAKPVGPEVVPGTYYAVLKVGKTTRKQAFVVTLDPRVKTSQAELQARFDLLMRLHDTVGAFDSSVNEAIAARDKLAKQTGKQGTAASQAQQAVAKLDSDINSVVDLKIQSGEGALVYPPRLRAWLTSIASQIGFALVPPTPSMVQVANMYIEQANTAEAQLRADVKAADAVMRR